MRTLGQAIDHFDNPLQPMGVNADDTEKRRLTLIDDLNSISHRNGTLAWVVVGTIVVLFFASLILVVVRGTADSTKFALAPLGISAAGCVWWLKIVWSEKTATELLLRLAVDLKGDALKQVINVLAQQALGKLPKTK